MAKKLSAAEARYSRFKILMRDPRLNPTDEDEVRAIAEKIRTAIKVKYFGTAFAGFVAGVLSLVFIVGFFVIPLSVFVIYRGIKELSYMKFCEESYIQNREWEGVSSYPR